MTSGVSGTAGLFAALLLLFGCANPPQPGQLVPTKHAVRELAEQFAEDVRWGRFDRAATLVHPDQRPVFRNWMQRNGSRLRVTSYAVDSVTRGATLDEVIAHVSFTLYRLPHVEERTVMAAQRWRFDAGWYLEPDLSVFSGRRAPEVGRYSDR